MSATQEMPPEMLALARAMYDAMTTTKAVSSTPTAVYGHGSGGLFSHPALERPLISAMRLPRAGLQGMLPVRPNKSTDPLYGLITGVTATEGNEPEGVCDDPPTAGLVKLCMQSTRYGRQSRMTSVYDIDRMDQVTDRGEHTDFQWIGSFPDGNTGNVPTLPGMSDALAAVANTELGKAAFQLAVAWQRDFARDFYEGNPANNKAGGGTKYYRGLDLLINTGHRDAESGQLCPAADSIVESFGNLDVASNGFALVRKITSMYHRLRMRAADMGLSPAKFVLSMNPYLFYELTEIWPCAYMTYQCSVTGTNDRTVTDTGRLMAMRDEMRGNWDTYDGQFLWILGDKVPVVMDVSVRQLGIGAGTQRSSIYFAPLTVLGGFASMYMEYLPYNDGVIQAANAFAGPGSYIVTDNGRFIWHRKPPTNFCVQMLAKTEPRLILLTPHLAARLTGVQYTPAAIDGSPFTDDAYFVNGGRTSRAGYGPSYYSPTTNG